MVCGGAGRVEMVDGVNGPFARPISSVRDANAAKADEIFARIKRSAS